MKPFCFIRYIFTVGLILGFSASLAGQMNEKRTLAETNHRIYDLAYSQGGEFIASTGSDNSIIIWSAETGIIYRTLAGLKKRPNQVAFGKDAKVLWSAGEDGLITRWDLILVKASSATLAHPGAISAMAMNSLGTRLITGGDDKMVRVWAIKDESLELLYELKGHKKAITSVDFSHDGMRAVSGGADKTLILWDMQSGGRLHELVAHEGWIRSVRFSPDGKQLASGGDDRLIHIWNSADMSPVRTLEGHTGWVQCLSYIPSGKLLISGSHDGTVRIWDTETGSQIAISDKLEQIVLSVEACPVRNDFISSCLLSEKLRIWAHAYNTESLTEKPESSSAGPETAVLVAAVPKNKLPSITIFSPMASGGHVVHDKSSILVVGKAEADGGVQTVVVNRKRAELNEAGVFQAEVELVKGENILEIVAVSATGKMGSTKLAILCTDETALETASVNSQSGLSQGRYYALIIGIDKYQDEKIDDLDFPISDATSFHETLVKYYNFKLEDITFLKNPTRTEMIISLDELRQKVTPEDNLLIFYAGHGFWDEKSGIGYWLPRDAAQSNTANWFRNSTLRDFIGSINSKHTLLIADACFSGSIFKSRAGFSSGEKGVMKLHDLPSRKAMTSGLLKEVPDQSVFVSYLIRELENNEARYLPSESLFGNFKTAVLNNSPNVPQYGTIQNVGDEGGDFVFIRK